MKRTAAFKAAEAADALRDWLAAQPARPHRLPDLPRKSPNALASKALTEAPAAIGRTLPGTDKQTDANVGSTESRSGVEHREPMRLGHSDWLHHRLTISGPADDLAAFRAAAAGAGTIPWHLDADQIEEDCFHLLVSPPPPQQRTLSVAGARILAQQLREAVLQRQELAVGRIGHSRACPFDLHALVPVPGAVLQRGPDDPETLAWLWENWGTTHALRQVAEDIAAGTDAQRRAAPSALAFHVTFWSADWTPWRALQHIAKKWSALNFETRPTYDLK
jgi:hypothetical protein